MAGRETDQDMNVQTYDDDTIDVTDPAYWLTYDGTTLELVDIVTDGLLFKNHSATNDLFDETHIETDSFIQQVADGDIVPSPIRRDRAVEWLHKHPHGTEYVEEAEHQDGRHRYWARFDSMADVKGDYNRYLDLIEEDLDE